MVSGEGDDAHAILLDERNRRQMYAQVCVDVDRLFTQVDAMHPLKRSSLDGDSVDMS